MQVTERMQALGDHAKSSRQPPVKERKRAKADESAARDVVDKNILENGATHDSAVAMPVDDATPQIFVHESSNDSALAEIATNEDTGESTIAASVAAEAQPQPTASNDSATQARSVQENDDTSAAKRAIIHEWENWSALHSDELVDPNVAEYFFRHLQTKRPQLLDVISDDKSLTVRKYLIGKGCVRT